MGASTDFDAPPRNQPEGDDQDSAQILAALGVNVRSGAVDPDDGDRGGLNEALGLLVADLSNWLSDEPAAEVMPQQADEFACSRCFLIYPGSRLARTRHGRLVCQDCA